MSAAPHTLDVEMLVRRPEKGDKVKVTLTARDIFEAKTRAAELEGVTYEDVQLLAIIDRGPQTPLAF